MKAKRVLVTTASLIALMACDEELVKSDGASQPPAPAQGIQAFVQVDNDQAGPGQEVRVWVRVQLGTEETVALGSYTARLRYDPEVLGHTRNVDIDDGLRVINANNAATGEIRFAGAQAGGLDDLTLYEGVFTVKESGFVSSLQLQIDELSGADLSDYRETLDLSPTVFLRRAGS